MSSLSQGQYNSPFSHIYIEETLLKHKKTIEILSRFPNAKQVIIHHYKDVFCRSKQNFLLQKNSPMLILAKKEQQLIYEGAPVCQSFGNKHFYYTSCVMNCIYDCEYCYLQGMYSSANLVLFLNLEDVFLEVETLLAKHPVYLCISYDTDLLALEGLFGMIHSWVEFTRKHADLTIEIRTKSANFSAIKDLSPCDNVILAWTLSPEDVIQAYEHNTPSLNARLQSAREAISAGYQVRLCFDPLIWIPEFQKKYGAFLQHVFDSLPYQKLFDVSIGVFRVSNDYLKRMRRQRPSSAIVWYPYEQSDGVYHYGHTRSNDMISFVYNQISNYIPEHKIFCWTDTN